MRVRSNNTQYTPMQGYSPRKRWLSLTPLINGLVEQEMLSTGDTLTIYFTEYGTKTNHPNTWYIKPYKFGIDNEFEEIPIIELRRIFPGFTYLNLTKTLSVNPEIIQDYEYEHGDDINRVWIVEIDTNGNEFIGNDGNTYKYYDISMSNEIQRQFIEDERPVIDESDDESN